MTSVTVYRVKIYNPQNDEMQISKRMATREGIRIMGGVIIGGTELEIDRSELEPGEEWTPRNFRPGKGDGGFQKSVQS